MSIQLFQRIQTEEVKIINHIIYINLHPIGIFIPSTIFAVQKNIILISGTKGVSEANINDINDIWTSIIAAGAILFGKSHEEISEVQQLLEDPISSRTISYLCTISKNCNQLIESYKKITSKTVAIVGIGGIGSLVAMALAGAGLKHLKLVDHDTIEQSNLNRQFLYRKADIGAYKVDILKREIIDRYPSVSIEIIKTEIHQNNLLSIIKNIDSLLVTADNPLGLDSHIMKNSYNKFDVTSCGYNNSTASLIFKPKNTKEQLIPKFTTEWTRIPNSIMPSFGPTNIELAGLASSIILLSLSSLINHDYNIKGIWETSNYPRIWK